MYMRDLINFLFTQMGPEKVYRTMDIDDQLLNLKNDFIETHQVEQMNEISNSIVDNYRMLYYQNGMRRHYAFSTLVGETANLITEDVIIDKEVFQGSGVALYTPDPYHLDEKGFTRESFIKFAEKMYSWKSQKKIQKRIDALAQFRTVVGYFVYTNKYGEASILDLTNQVITLYKDTDKEMDKMFTKHITKSSDDDTFLCSTFKEEEKVNHYWYMDKNLMLKEEINKKVADLLGHWDFKIHPGTYDLFGIWENGKTHIYSVKYNLIYNTFDMEWRLLNVLNPDPRDYNSRTLLLLFNHDTERTDDEDRLAFTPLHPSRPEEKGKYIEIPKTQTRIMKQIIGLDIIYTIVDNPEYMELSEEEKKDTKIYPYVFTLMYMDENNEFTIKEIPAASIPVSIYVSKEYGVITLIYKQDVFYNTVSFFREVFTEYKYSYMELSTQGVREKYQKKLTAKNLAKLKAHLLETATIPKTAEDEYNQMHSFIKVRTEEEQMSQDPINANPILASSYFIDLTNMKVEYDVERMFINVIGKFVDIQYSDKSIRSRMRYIDNTFNVEEELKRIIEEREWLEKHIEKKGDKDV